MSMRYICVFFMIISVICVNKHCTAQKNGKSSCNYVNDYFGQSRPHISDESRPLFPDEKKCISRAKVSQQVKGQNGD